MRPGREAIREEARKTKPFILRWSWAAPTHADRLPEQPGMGALNTQMAVGPLTVLNGAIRPMVR